MQQLPGVLAAALPDLLMSLKTTMAPSFVKRWAIPKPMPEAAPGTIATFLSNLDIGQLVAIWDLLFLVGNQKLSYS